MGENKAIIEQNKKTNPKGDYLNLLDVVHNV